MSGLTRLRQISSRDRGRRDACRLYKEPHYGQATQVLFGEIPEKVARYSPASVLVVKRYEGHVRSMFKRVFG